MAYDNRKRHKYDYEFRPKYEKNYYDFDDNQESSYLDDYTTSAMSYEESIKRRPTSPYSKSDYGRQRHRESYRPKSPRTEYDIYLKEDDIIKKRSKQTKNDIRDVFYQFAIENEKFKRFRKKDDFKDPIFEDIDDNFEYSKYFEKTTSKGRKPKKFAIEDVVREERRKDKQKNYSGRENDYQVFAYTESKLNEKLFKPNSKNRESSDPSSEIEINNTDYPILAFKDNKASQNPRKTSSVLYVPTVIRADVISKPAVKTKRKTQSRQPGDTSVYEGNASDKKDRFTQENERIKQDSKKLKEDSNARISTETQTEESLIFENKSYKNVGSILGSILQGPEYATKIRENNSFRKTKGTKHESVRFSKNNTNSFVYKTGAGYGPVKKSIFGSKALKINPMDENSDIEYKQLDDTLRDNYPVTKDYIKVNDNSSLQIKENVISSKIYPSPRTSTDLKSIKHSSYVSMDNHAESSGLYNRDTYRLNENHRKNILKPTGTKRDQSTDYTGKTLHPQNTQIFRSTITNPFKAFDLQKSSISSSKDATPPKSALVDNNASILSSNTKKLSEAPSIYETKQKSTNGENEIEQEVLSKDEKLSVAKQRGTSLVDDSIKQNSGLEIKDKSLSMTRSKSQLSMRESRKEKPVRESQLVARKSQSVIRESQVVNPNYSSNVTENQNENRPENIKFSRVSSLKSKKSKSILKKPSKKSSVIKKTEIPESNYFTEENVKHSGEIQDPNEEKSSEIRPLETSEIKNNTFMKQDKKLSSRSQSKIKSEDEIKPPTQNMRQSLASRSGEYPIEDNKSNSSLRKSKSKIAPSRSREYPIEENQLNSSSKQSKSKRAASRSGEYPIEENQSNSLSKQSKSKRVASRSGEYPIEENQSNSLSKQSKSKRAASRSGGYPIEENQSNSLSKQSKSKRAASRSGEYRIEENKSDSLSKKSKSKSASSRSIEYPIEENQSNSSSRKSKSKSVASRSREYPINENRSNSSSKKSKSKSAPPKKSFSRLFKRSKSRTRAEDKRASSIKKSQTSQQKISKKQSSKVKLNENASNVERTKSKSKVWGFLSKSKSKHEIDETPEATPEHDNDTQKPVPEKNSTEGKPCECVVQYVKQAREYGNFFLGTTLHEQIMDILKVV